jgi:hypothetical protein
VGLSTELYFYCIRRAVLPYGIQYFQMSQKQCFFYDFLFFAQVAPLKHILKPIHPDVG